MTVSKALMMYLIIILYHHKHIDVIIAGVVHGLFRIVRFVHFGVSNLQHSSKAKLNVSVKESKQFITVLSRLLDSLSVKVTVVIKLFILNLTIVLAKVCVKC